MGTIGPVYPGSALYGSSAYNHIRGSEYSEPESSGAAESGQETFRSAMQKSSKAQEAEHKDQILVTYEINGIEYYRWESTGPSEPSGFEKLSQDWIEGERKETLDPEELDKLVEKYTRLPMDRASLLKDMVEAGILSKQTAENIYDGFTPLDESKIQFGVGIMTKSTPQYEQSWRTVKDLRGLQRTGQDWLTYYTAAYHVSIHDTNVEVADSKFYHEYSNFLKVLEQLAG